MRITKKQLNAELDTVSRAIKTYTRMSEGDLRESHRKVFPEDAIASTKTPGELLNDILQSNLHYVRMVFQTY